MASFVLIVPPVQKLPCVPEKSRLSLWSITSVMLNGKTWFMRHSNGNDMAKQTCHIRRPTQLALLTGGAQDEHPCAAAPWAGARSESAPLRCWIICGIWLASVLAWSLPWLLPYCNGLFACTRAFIKPHRKKLTELRCPVTWAPFPHVFKLKNLSWSLYSVTIRLICVRCVVWYHIVGITIFFFDRFQSSYLASPEWTQSFLNMRLLVHRHRITMLIFKESRTMVSSSHIAIKHDRRYYVFKSVRER